MRILTILIASAIVAAPAYAEEAPQHGDHDTLGSEIVVTGVYARDRSDILSGTSVLTADDLRREMRPTIGETLSHQAGVSATSFGPNASRPILRGFQGERVRVLSDGIGSFDVSNTSVDHAVVINPLTADRIEVLRGPAALLFGSSAIGGVVNVIDSRIPRTVPTEAIHIDGTATYGSAANERSGGARIDVPLGDRFVVHFDGTYTKTDDLRTGGHILTPSLRAAALASGDPDIAALADLKGDLPNSAGRAWEIAGGAAYITTNANLGFSVSHYDNLYGVPVRYSLDPAVEAEEVRLDVKQTRVDWRGEVKPDSGFLEAIRLRGGYADYKHNEIDDTGAIGTTFLNQGWESRLELVQREKNGWRGAIGGQFFLRDLNIIGEEKFLPKSETQQYGLFTLQSFDFGAIRAEAGGRIEHSILSASADADLGTARFPQRLEGIQAASGRQFLGIVQQSGQFHGHAGRKNNRGGDHGAGKRPPSSLIDAGDVSEGGLHVIFGHQLGLAARERHDAALGAAHALEEEGPQAKQQQQGNDPAEHLRQPAADQLARILHARRIHLLDQLRIGNPGRRERREAVVASLLECAADNRVADRNFGHLAAANQSLELAVRDLPAGRRHDERLAEGQHGEGAQHPPQGCGFRERRPALRGAAGRRGRTRH